MQVPRSGSDPKLTASPSKLPALKAAGGESASSSAAPSPLGLPLNGPASGGEAAPAPPAQPAQPVHHRHTSSSASVTADSDAPVAQQVSARRPSSGVCASQRQVEQEIIYEKLPADIADRFVMLMDPILGSGTSALRAIQVGARRLQRGLVERPDLPC